VENLFMQEHEKGLQIAQEDAYVAKILLKFELFSSVAYHSQQAAEKALKAYLVFKKHELSKTHDLIKLFIVCKRFDLEFEKIYGMAEYLNPFATKFRYPTEFDIPDLSDSRDAVKCANVIIKFVLKKIAEPETGQTRFLS